MGASRDYGLNRKEAAAVLKEVQEAIRGWRQEASRLNIPNAEQDLMADAFQSWWLEFSRWMKRRRCGVLLWDPMALKWGSAAYTDAVCRQIRASERDRLWANRTHAIVVTEIEETKDVTVKDKE
jgi:hypothetical protein